MHKFSINYWFMVSIGQIILDCITLQMPWFITKLTGNEIIAWVLKTQIFIEIQPYIQYFKLHVN